MIDRSQSGFSLVELMIAVTIAMALSIAVMYVYAGQIRTFSQVARKEQTSQEARTAFEVMSNLVRQADICLSADTNRCPTNLNISLAYPNSVSNPNPATTLERANDSVQIDFVTPSGYDIWPNSTSPYTNNAIRVEWSSTDGIVWISAGGSVTDGTRATRFALAGGSGNMNTRIINLDLWPQQVSSTGAVSDAASKTAKPTGGYRLSMTARVGTQDSTYTNALDPTGTNQHYRTITYQRNIIPRNW